MQDNFLIPSNGVATSNAAADSLRPHVVRLLTEVVMHIEKCADYGCTSDEAEQALSLSHQTCSARFHQAHRAGLIIRTGFKRKTRSGREAFVYRYAKLPEQLF